jgi:hypothetical protein
MSTNPALDPALLERLAREAFNHYLVEGRSTGPDADVDMLGAQLAASSIQDPNVHAQSSNNCYLCTIAAVAGITVEEAQQNTGYQHSGPARPEVIAELARLLDVSGGNPVLLQSASQAEQIIKAHPDVPSWGLAYTQTGAGHMINAKLDQRRLVLRDHQAKAQIDLGGIGAATDVFLFPFTKGWA